MKNYFLGFFLLFLEVFGFLLFRGVLVGVLATSILKLKARWRKCKNSSVCTCNRIGLYKF